MARVKRGTTTHARHKKVLKQSKGFYGRTSTTYRAARQRLEKSLREIFPDPNLVVAPYLVVGGTDARIWSDLSTQTFRFLAAPMPADALQRAHGTNERVEVGGYVTAIRFFERLLRNTTGM